MSMPWPHRIAILFLGFSFIAPTLANPASSSSDLRRLLFSPDDSDHDFLGNLDLIVEQYNENRYGRNQLSRAMASIVDAAGAFYLVRRLMIALPHHWTHCVTLLRFLVKDLRLQDVTQLAVGMVVAVWSEVENPIGFPQGLGFRVRALLGASSAYVPLFSQILDVVVPFYRPVLETDLAQPILETLDEFMTSTAQPPPEPVCGLRLPYRIAAAFSELPRASRAVIARHSHLLRTDPNQVRLLLSCGLHFDLDALPWASTSPNDLRSLSPFLFLSDDALIRALTDFIFGQRHAHIAALCAARTVQLAIRDWPPSLLFGLCQGAIHSPSALRDLVGLAPVRDALRCETVTGCGWTLLHSATACGRTEVVQILLSTPGLDLCEQRDDDGRLAADYAAPHLRSLSVPDVSSTSSSSSRDTALRRSLRNAGRRILSVLHAFGRQ